MDDAPGARSAVVSGALAVAALATALLEQAVELEDLFRGEHATALRIAASLTIGEYLLPPLLARWKQQAQALACQQQARAFGRQAGFLASGQQAPVQLHTIDAVAHRDFQLAIGGQLQRGMVWRHMGVVQHPGVVQRPAQRHRPGVHVQRAPHTAVAVQQFDQRNALFGGRGEVQPKPSR